MQTVRERRDGGHGARSVDPQRSLEHSGRPPSRDENHHASIPGKQETSVRGFLTVEGEVVRYPRRAPYYLGTLPTAKNIARSLGPLLTRCDDNGLSPVRLARSDGGVPRLPLAECRQVRNRVRGGTGAIWEGYSSVEQHYHDDRLPPLSTVRYGRELAAVRVGVVVKQANVR